MFRLKKLLAGIGYAIAVSAITIIVFLLLCRPVGYLRRVVLGEILIFKKLTEFTKPVFPGMHHANTFLILFLALLGIGLCIYIAGRLSMFAARKALPAYAHHKRAYLRAGAVSFCIILLLAVLLTVELIYCARGFMPGSYYGSIDFVSTNIEVYNDIVADADGLTTYKDGDLHGPVFNINRQGFNAGFDYDTATITAFRNKGKKIVFIIGDSYVQGITTGLMENTFVEILRRNNPGMVICNFGVGGADAVNYRLIAEKYIPAFKPDMVWVVTCAWNDLVDYKRVPKPYTPYVKHTSAGFLFLHIPPVLAGVTNLYLPPDSAYSFYRKRYSLFEKGPVCQTIGRSAFTTALYTQYFASPVYEYSYPRDSFAVYGDLSRIKAICVNDNIPFNLFLIPTPGMAATGVAEIRNGTSWVFRELLPEVQFCEPGYLSKQDFISEADMHFNENGNIKYAAYLQQRLTGLMAER